MSAPENGSSDPSSDEKASEPTVGDFVEILPKDGEWHRFNIGGQLFDAKYGGTFGYIDEGGKVGWSPSSSTTDD